MTTKQLFDRLHILRTSFVFIKDHFWVLLSLGLIASIGRVIQLGGFGEISSGTNIVFEVVVETSRVLILLFVLGFANIRKGAFYLKKVFTSKSNFIFYLSLAWQQLKLTWVVVLLNFAGFLVIAGVFNFLIDQLAYETCLFLTLQREGLLASTASEWTILLFFKNILTIPFTLVFETIVVLWLVNKMTTPDCLTPRSVLR